MTKITTHQVDPALTYKLEGRTYEECVTCGAHFEAASAAWSDPCPAVPQPQSVPEERQHKKDPRCYYMNDVLHNNCVHCRGVFEPGSHRWQEECPSLTEEQPASSLVSLEMLRAHLKQHAETLRAASNAVGFAIAELARLEQQINEAGTVRPLPHTGPTREILGSHIYPAPYGYCPTCKLAGKVRTRGIPSYTVCPSGHRHLSEDMLTFEQAWPSGFPQNKS